MDGRDGLQLLPGTKKRLGLKVPGENRYLYIGSAILGAVLVLSFSLGKYQTSLEGQIEQLNEQIVALEQSRGKKDEDNLRILKDRLLVTTDLVKEHIYWTRALTIIESVLQSEVQFESLAGSIRDKKVNIKATAANYAVLARQIASFLAGEGILDVSIGRISPIGTGKIEFDMGLSFDMERFVQKNSP